MITLEEKTTLFTEIMERIRYNRKKRQLKVTLRRKQKPAKVIINDEDVPETNERSLNAETTETTSYTSEPTQSN